MKKELERLNLVKGTDLPLDDIIGHRESQPQYFTAENNNIIYSRLREETDIYYLPQLGVTVNYGLGDICLEECVNEEKELYKFYIIDRTAKFDYAEFENIESAIGHLVSFYESIQAISEPEKMLNIFLETLGLNNNQKKEEQVSILKKTRKKS